MPLAVLLANTLNYDCGDGDGETNFTRLLPCLTVKCPCDITQCMCIGYRDCSTLTKRTEQGMHERCISLHCFVVVVPSLSCLHSIESEHLHTHTSLSLVQHTSFVPVSHFHAHCSLFFLICFYYLHFLFCFSFLSFPSSNLFHVFRGKYFCGNVLSTNSYSLC